MILVIQGPDPEANETLANALRSSHNGAKKGGVLMLNDATSRAENAQHAIRLVEKITTGPVPEKAWKLPGAQEPKAAEGVAIGAPAPAAPAAPAARRAPDPYLVGTVDVDQLQWKGDPIIIADGHAGLQMLDEIERRVPGFIAHHGPKLSVKIEPMA